MAGYLDKLLTLLLLTLYYITPRSSAPLRHWSHIGPNGAGHYPDYMLDYLYHGPVPYYGAGAAVGEVTDAPDPPEVPEGMVGDTLNSQAFVTDPPDPPDAPDFTVHPGLVNPVVTNSPVRLDGLVTISPGVVNVADGPLRRYTVEVTDGPDPPSDADHPPPPVPSVKTSSTRSATQASVAKYTTHVRSENRLGWYTNGIGQVPPWSQGLGNSRIPLWQKLMQIFAMFWRRQTR